MQTIYLVTGNAHKLANFTRLLPSDITIEAVDIDLVEIQSFDSETIVTDKAKRAYEAVGAPVLVEDVAAGIDALQGLPGPFIKFFEKQLGDDALYQLLGDRPNGAVVTSTLGYYDGETMLITHGVVHGSLVPARGTNGFGFDCCFVPNEQDKTYAEMTNDQKDAISHRTLSLQAMIPQLKQL